MNNKLSTVDQAKEMGLLPEEFDKITDILGREVNENRNTPLFYIYNDGTVEKKIIIE